MEIKKIEEKFNLYKAEVSWGELQAILQATTDCASPACAEIAESIQWHMDKGDLTPPGVAKPDEKGKGGPKATGPGEVVPSESEAGGGAGGGDSGGAPSLPSGLGDDEAEAEAEADAIVGDPNTGLEELEPGTEEAELEEPEPEEEVPTLGGLAHGQ